MTDRPDIPAIPPEAYRERRGGDPIDWDGIERRQTERRESKRRIQERCREERRQRERRRIEDIIERGWPLPGEDGA